MGISNKDDFCYLASCYYDLSICCGMCKYRRKLHFFKFHVKMGVILVTTQVPILLTKHSALKVKKNLLKPYMPCVKGALAH